MECFQTYEEVVMIRFVKQLFVIEIVPKQVIDLLIVQSGSWSWSNPWTNSTWWKSWNKLQHLMRCDTNWPYDPRTFLVRMGQCKVVKNNSWTLYKNVPWSNVSSFKFRFKLKNEFLIYKKKVQVPFLFKFNIKSFVQ